MDVHESCAWLCVCVIPGCVGWNESCGAGGNAAVVGAAELLNASKLAKSALAFAFCAVGVQTYKHKQKMGWGMKLWDECVQRLGQFSFFSVRKWKIIEFFRLIYSHISVKIKSCKFSWLKRWLRMKTLNALI